MTASIRASAQIPASPAATGMSKTVDWVLRATLDQVPTATVTPDNARLAAHYGDTPPTDITEGTSMWSGKALLDFDQLTYRLSGTVWRADISGIVGQVAAAAGHHVYLLVYDGTAGGSAPVLYDFDLGAVPA